MKKLLILCLSMLLLFAVIPFALAQEPAVKLDELSPAEEKAYVEELLAREEAERKTTFHQQQSVDLRFWQELLELNEKELEQIKKNASLPARKNALLQDKIEKAIADLQKDPSLSDEEKISWLLSTLFRLQDLDLYNNQAVDFSVFMEKSLPFDPGCQYFLDWTSYYRQYWQFRVEEGFLKMRRATQLEFKELLLFEDMASVELECHRYSHYEGDGRGSHSTFLYTIHLIKSSEGWLIRSMHSDDAIEQYYLEQGKRLDVEKMVQELRNPEEMPEEIKALNAKAEQEHKAFLEREEARKQQLMEGYKRTEESIETRTYNRNAASSYAITYDSYTAEDYEDLDFDFIDGTDCQNFASQCLWRGFGGSFSGIENLSFPMISSGIRAWHPGVTTWTYVPHFETYMDDGGYDKAGPYGFLYYGNLAYTQVGDILLLNRDGNASAGAQDHAYIVTNVYGTYGERTTDDIKVSAHTDPRENELLSDIGVAERKLLLISVGEWVEPE